MHSETLRSDMDQLQQQRRRIEQEHSRTAEALSDVRTRFEAGEASGADLADAASSHEALSGELERVRAQLSDLSTALAQAERREATDAARAHVSALAAERTRVLEAFFEARREAAAALRQLGQEMYRLNQRWQSIPSEIRSELESVGLDVSIVPPDALTSTFRAPSMEPIEAAADQVLAALVTEASRSGGTAAAA